MKRLLYIFFLLVLCTAYSQENNERLNKLKQNLELLSIESPGLTENYKTDINVSNITLSNLLKAVSRIHKLNINVASDLNNINVINNFPEVTVFDLLLFLCKEYNLTMEFTGNIIAVKPFVPIPDPVTERIIPVSFNPNNSTITIDAKGDVLYELFKRITDVSGKNLAFAPGLDNTPITSYIVDAPFDVAMYKLAMTNNLITEKSKDGFWMFESDTKNSTNSNKTGTFNSDIAGNSFRILDYDTKLLEVNFNNKSIARIINEISNELNIDVFTATPLKQAGAITFKSKSITFDDLLIKIFEPQKVSSDTSTNQNNSNNRNNAAKKTDTKPLFNFKKEGQVYFFGTEDQLSVRTIEVVRLKHRSVALLSDPEGANGMSSVSNKVLNNLNGVDNNYSNAQYNNGANNRNSSYSQNSQSNSFNRLQSTQENSESLLSILPEEATEGLNITVDYELESFYVSGSAAAVERFKKFIAKIDQPVPVILVEVMIIEAKKNAEIETGISWGIGDEPATTKGNVFPEANMTLGANTVNKLIGSFNSFSGFNLGRVGPNFFATIKAMESNGDLKIRSTPKLATLNSHRATFSNGQTSFYAVTRRNIYGTDNPQTSEITNYLPIDAELGLTIKPSVSGNGQVTLDISVIQSSFGTRIADDAPPDIISRSFSSIIRMQDQDVAILGGLEEQMRNRSRQGVPLLAKVPVLNLLFSKKKRFASKSKLTILIKPTVIN